MYLKDLTPVSFQGSIQSSTNDDAKVMSVKVMFALRAEYGCQHVCHFWLINDASHDIACNAFLQLY